MSGSDKPTGISPNTTEQGFIIPTSPVVPVVPLERLPPKMQTFIKSTHKGDLEKG